MSNIKAWSKLVSGRALHLQTDTFLFFLTWSFIWECTERKKDLLSLLFLIRTLALLSQDPTLMTSFNLNYFHKYVASYYSHIGQLRVQHVCVWGDTNIDSIAQGIGRDDVKGCVLKSKQKAVFDVFGATAESECKRLSQVLNLNIKKREKDRSQASVYRRDPETLASPHRHPHAGLLSIP